MLSSNWETFSDFGDAAFQANLTSATPVPFEFNPALGLVLLGGGLAWRKFSKKKA